MKDRTLVQITESIINNQMALDSNEQIKHTIYYKHGLKSVLNRLNKFLLKAEKEEYNKFLDSNADFIDELYNVKFDLIKELSTIGIEHYSNILEMIKAYKKDSKSIAGIVNKINR